MMIVHTKTPITAASWDRTSEPATTPSTASSAAPTRWPKPQSANVAAPIAMR